MAAFAGGRRRRARRHDGDRGRHRRPERDGDARRGRRALRDLAAAPAARARRPRRARVASASSSARRSRARLRALAEHRDGFQLAEIDLELRGEGELLGTRQSGLAAVPRRAPARGRASCSRRRARSASALLDADPELALARARAARRRAARRLRRRGARADPGLSGVRHRRRRTPAAGAAWRRRRGAAHAPDGRPRPRGAVLDRSAPASTGARVLDLFAGSGALGIEALSRGAAAATFVERAPAALRGAPRQPRGARRGGRGASAPTPCGALRSASRGRANTIWSSSTRHTGAAATLGPALGAALPAVLAAGAPRGRRESTAGRRSSSESPLIDERRYGDTLIRIHGP